MGLDSPDAFLPGPSLSLQCEQYQSSSGRHCKPKQSATISIGRDHERETSPQLHEVESISK